MREVSGDTVQAGSLTPAFPSRFLWISEGRKANPPVSMDSGMNGLFPPKHQRARTAPSLGEHQDHNREPLLCSDCLTAHEEREADIYQ